jgi:hypothetical protein
MTDIELKELVANLAVRQSDSEHRLDRTEQYLEQAARDLAESAQNQKELARAQQETARQLKDLARETNQQIKELGRQIGGLGEKFGGFTEGMAYPSMKKILEQKFHMTTVSPRVTSRKNGRTMELDVLAYSNSTVNEVYVVEVKSHLHESGLDQMLRILREFHDFFPGHQGKKVYGILAAVDVPDNLRQRVLKAGIFMANVHDDTFELQVPEGFQPHAY